MTGPVRLRLTLPGGPGPEVDAYPTPTLGLVIHRSLAEDAESYTVTHAASGVPIAAGLPSPEAALGLAVDLGTLADWTAPVDEGLVRREGLALARRWGWSRSDRKGIPAELARAAGVFR